MWSFSEQSEMFASSFGEYSRNCGDLTARGGEFAVIPYVPHSLPPDSAFGGAARRSIIPAAAAPTARIPLLTG